MQVLQAVVKQTQGFLVRTYTAAKEKGVVRPAKSPADGSVMFGDRWHKARMGCLGGCLSMHALG